MQFFILGSLILIVILSVRQWLPQMTTQGRARLRKAFVLIGLLAFLLFAARANWVLPLIGAMVVAVLRLVPALLPLIPALLRLFRHSTQGEGTKDAPPPGGGRMSRQEAYEILGLNPNATKEEIVIAHRRLMQKMHPDRGGSDYLAVKINQARDTLLGN